jgi:ribosome maturation factor RimP
MERRTQEEAIAKMARPVVEDFGCELYDVEVMPGLVRIAVDKENGIGIETLSEISLVLSRVLDTKDLVASRAYDFEVTSPGLERKLRQLRHFEKSIGQTAKFTLREPLEGSRHITAEILSVEGGEVTVDLGDSRKFSLKFDEIEEAKTVFVWKSDSKGKLSR